jgi:hypothetical protein
MEHGIRNAFQTLVKFAGLTILAAMALAASAFINYATMECTQMQLRAIAPGFNLLIPGRPLLASMLQLLGI